MVTKEFHSFAELEQFLPKGKKKNANKKEFKPDTKYTRTNDTDFARFSRFEKLAENTKIKFKQKKTKSEIADLEEEIN